MNRTAIAVWLGTGKEGHGVLATQSGVLSSTQYSFNSRFAEGIGTNPEELLAAAHAGCFSMKLAFVLAGHGVKPESIETKCTVALNDGIISSSHLEIQVKATIDPEKFQSCIEDAKLNCPISKSLNTNITAEATLL